MKILITGAKGMLGTQVALDLKRGYTELGSIPQSFVGAEVVLADVDTLDITDKAATEKFIADCAPDVVINCAAYTNVDGCEVNTDLAMSVNGTAVANIAEAAKENDATFIHISTDYVFPGNLPVDQVYTEDMEPAPVSAYGRTKLVGEEKLIEFSKKSIKEALDISIEQMIDSKLFDSYNIKLFTKLIDKAVQLSESNVNDLDAIKQLGEGWVAEEALAIAIYSSTDNSLKIIETVSSYQQKLLETHGSRIVFLADEFYLKAQVPLPDFEHYEDFPQLENGVGMWSLFLSEALEAIESDFSDYILENERKITDF